ncbi:MAG TPA: hypothetical protein PKA66_13725 [Gemmatimonadales bacterium]|nr:hypothetical protein [Gemmatimonadales bacterium]
MNLTRRLVPTSLVLACLLSPAIPDADCSAQQPTLLAVVGEDGGHLLAVQVSGGALQPARIAASALALPFMGRGVLFSGRGIAVELDSVNADYEPPDTEIYTTLSEPVPRPDKALFDSVGSMMDSMRIFARVGDTPQARAFLERYFVLNRRALASYAESGRSNAVLVSFGRDSISFVPPDTAPVARELLALLHTTADSLWIQALADLPMDERIQRFSFGRAEYLRASPDDETIHVWIQAVTDGGDPRGSFYFVVDAASQRVRHASFGHPEWSPRSALVQLRPRMLFRLAATSPIYVLAESSEAWEDYSGGWSILEYRTGRVVATSH